MQVVAWLPSLRRVDFAVPYGPISRLEPDGTAIETFAAFGTQTHLQQLHMQACCSHWLAALQLPPSLTVRTALPALSANLQSERVQTSKTPACSLHDDQASKWKCSVHSSEAPAPALLACRRPRS